MTVSRRVSQLQTRTVSTLVWSKFTKAHNYVKTVRAVNILVLCTLPSMYMNTLKAHTSVNRDGKFLKFSPILDE